MASVGRGQEQRLGCTARVGPTGPEAGREERLLAGEAGAHSAVTSFVDLIRS